VKSSLRPTVEIPHQTRAGATSEDEDLWALALEEFEGSKRRTGLWAKCYAEASGNEAVAKAAYLSARNAQMQSEAEAALRQKQLEAAAEKESQALREKLGEVRAELLDCVQFIKANGIKTPVAIFIKVTLLLGGSVERVSTRMRYVSWIVSFKEHSATLLSDREFCDWFLTTVLPVAEADLPERAGIASLGCCPHCSAMIPLNAATCLGCQAIFGPGSAWKPLPRSEA